LELGSGFAFVGRQVPLKVGRKDYFLGPVVLSLEAALLCSGGIEDGTLRTGACGQDELLPHRCGREAPRHPDDKPSIGLLLCKDNDKLVVEYALRDVAKPIGVAEWKTRLVARLPKKLQGALPSVKDIEKELSE
jgi:hypothetical protein